MAKKAVKKNKVDKHDIGRLVAIFSYVTLVGWVLALVLNLNNKTEIGSYHIRQALLLLLALKVLAWIPILGWIIAVVLIVFWIRAIIWAVNGQKKEIPVIGRLAQDWFKGL